MEQYITKNELKEELKKMTQIIIDHTTEKITSVMTEQVAAVRTELTGQITSVRTELTEQITAVRIDLTGQITSVQAELTEQITTVNAGLSEQIASVSTDLSEQIRHARVLIEELDDKFVHAAEYDRTIIEKIEREKAEQEAINGRVDMRLLRIEAVPKRRKRYA